MPAAAPAMHNIREPVEFVILLLLRSLGLKTSEVEGAILAKRSSTLARPLARANCYFYEAISFSPS
jgi:hypothetical protein